MESQSLKGDGGGQDTAIGVSGCVPVSTSLRCGVSAPHSIRALAFPSSCLAILFQESIRGNRIADDGSHLSEGGLPVSITGLI